jgi:hypothetical protein
VSIPALLSWLDAIARQEIVQTLTPQRLSKYLLATGHDIECALQLYVLNTQVSGALMIDLHYVEIALRNQFDRELAARFGATWFTAPGFLGHVGQRMQESVQKALRDASRSQRPHGPLPPGKVIAELTFGFWLQLTDRRFEHVLWTPVLHKAFAPRKAPKRSAFNHLLEKLRQLRNRVAHHEPVFHLNLVTAHQQLRDACRLLCPPTADLMEDTSTLKAEVGRLTQFMAGLRVRPQTSVPGTAPIAP